MIQPSSILIVDDEPSMLHYLKTLLEIDSYRVETVSNGTDAIQRVQQNPAPDVVLLDLLMPKIDGMETLERLRQIRPGLKVIMLTCSNDARKAVQAMRLGAQDYLTKPFQKADLDAAIKNCLSRPSRLPGAVASETRVEGLNDDSFFVAASPAMLKIRAQAAQVANISVSVLLLGESGVGKEVVARLIYKLSPRSDRPFLKVNCAALPGELLESELFGYEAGAFTGAYKSKPGKFEQADKGTIMLDEIAEMPVGLQAKLLHVLQDQEFSRLGSRSTIKVDVRILAATNVDIKQAIAAKKLREDLYYRLNAFTINIPPLRERKEEIPMLVKQFTAVWAERYALSSAPQSTAFLDACAQHNWPGNVRELENFVRRSLIIGDEALVLNELRLSTSVLPHRESTTQHPAGSKTSDLKSMVRDMKGEAEKEAIARALGQTHWSRKEAAKLLNISYKALLYKVRQYGIDQR
ncbi:MAG: sigma-54-dependent transcriptional regulator [Terriglobia bacterium]